jgi:hypothetical protein
LEASVTFCLVDARGTSILATDCHAPTENLLWFAGSAALAWHAATRQIPKAIGFIFMLVCCGLALRGNEVPPVLIKARK